ncbi:hypothetical protein HAX54_002575 [Datura stramonium]|uniref:Uncharacterized protein n=1 Tax=Datura stramonium TaxID=4076 RepID=A0ABS8T444_DATST|nr:hypothetical protein [Datura stramonium]
MNLRGFFLDNLGVKSTERRPPVNRLSGSVKCRLKRSSRCKASGHCPEPVFHLHVSPIFLPRTQLSGDSIMSILKRGKRKTPITDATALGAESEARFEVDSFKDDFPNIYNQFQIRDWEPFTIPLDPYFPELVREFYASYRAL